MVSTADDRALPHAPGSWECESCWLARPIRLCVGGISVDLALGEHTLNATGPTEVERGIPKPLSQPGVSPQLH